MLKNYPIIKRIVFSICSVFFALLLFGFWLFSLIPSNESIDLIKKTSAHNISYLKQGVKRSRGKILAVVTSTKLLGNSGKNTGYELTELARAYYVFQANGFDVDIASPKGGNPPVVIDGDDMGEFDYAFLNDSSAQEKVKNSYKIDSVLADEYSGIYFVGGKGAMFDFPKNAAIQKLVKNYYQQGKVIGAVCHGPAALVNVMLDNGQSLLANKTVSSFTNAEELLLIPNAKEIFPFLLQDELAAHGASFKEGPLYLKQVSRDGNLITGQNPWSVWGVAESMIEQLGYTPVTRQATGEENTVSILNTYERKGFGAAKAQIKSLLAQDNKPINRILLAMHIVVAGMQAEIGKSFDILKLLAAAKV